jgi:hypothetical protein
MFFPRIKTATMHQHDGRKQILSLFETLFREFRFSHIEVSPLQSTAAVSRPVASPTHVELLDAN